MSHIDKRKNLQPSILDRLIDNEPTVKFEAEKTRYQRLRDLRESVRRDLENLLNTRIRLISPPSTLPNLEDSLLNYGLPDLATVNILDVKKRREFTRKLEEVLTLFEPRFKTVEVSFRENINSLDRTLRFRVNATLYADPAPEIVIYDSTLDPASQIVSIEETDV